MRLERTILPAATRTALAVLLVAVLASLGALILKGGCTMKKEKKTHAMKLSLGRETLLQLQDSTLAKADGAAWTHFATCTGYSYCTPCIDP
jgi:hypothetical protein